MAAARNARPRSSGRLGVASATSCQPVGDGDAEIAVAELAVERVELGRGAVGRRGEPRRGGLQVGGGEAHGSPQPTLQNAQWHGAFSSRSSSSSSLQSVIDAPVISIEVA